MNQAQVSSIVRLAANAVGGALMAHGATKAASIVNAEDSSGLIVVIVMWIWSHFFTHSDEAEATPTPLPASKGGGTLPPVALVFIACAGLSGLLLAGCAGSLNANVFHSEQLVTDSARNATHAFNQYYLAATNGATPDSIAKLDAARQTVYELDVQLYHSLKTVEGLRQAYVVNSADTNKTALQLAVAVAESQGSNVMWQVMNFRDFTVIEKR